MANKKLANIKFIKNLFKLNFPLKKAKKNIKQNNYISLELPDAMLIYANVMHKRTLPKINRFLYKVFYICIDLKKIKNIKCKFFSINSFNIFSFYEKDHGKRDGSSLELWIRNLLIDKNLNDCVNRIFLYTHPRFLGYVFNPVSFWFCVDKDNNLRAILFEVNNTFSQSHCYLVYNENKTIITSDQWFECDKKFYVSPFFEIIGNYKFRVHFTANKIAVWIDYVIAGKKNLLTNVISYDIKFFSPLIFLNAFLKIPFLTFKVILLIHWQALKLFFKKLKFISNPNIISKNISTNND